MPDFLTGLSDSEVLSKAKQIAKEAALNPAKYNLTPEIADEIVAEAEVLSVDLANHLASKAQARSMRLKKDASIKRMKNVLRSAARRVRLKPGNIKPELAALEILPRAEFSAAAATRPVGRVDTGSRFQHTLYLTDEAAPALKRKPKGALGCEIFVKVGGDPPVGLNECRYETTTARVKYVVEFDGADVGKQAHYLLRWRMRDGSVSSLGETVSATVTG